MSLLNQILIISFIVIILGLVFFLLMAWSARKTLYKGGVAWSAKELPIKRNTANNDSSLLKEIEVQSNEFLKEQENEKSL